ncbi:hypothetical protein WI664_17945 [Vibrio cholerae]
MTLLVLWAAGAAFASRYRIGIDPQQEKCLPGYTFFLIDLNDQTLERELFTPSSQEHAAFLQGRDSHGQNPHRYAGDKVEINDKWKITVNGDVVGEGSSSQGNYICQRATFTARPR